MSLHSKFLLAILATEVVLCCGFTCNSSFDPPTDHCPPWAYWNPDREICQCSDKRLPQIDCHITHSALRENSCAHYDNQSRVTMLARCPFHPGRKVVKTSYIQLPNENLNLNSLCVTPSTELVFFAATARKAWVLPC